ncbi:MAG: two-component regulator propeller domain-containing protein [Planctomycetota bacterium]
MTTNALRGALAAAALPTLALAAVCWTGASTVAQQGADPYFMPPPETTTAYMPRVIIRNIRQDRAGNVWFATFGGPIRYDGKEFTNFGEQTGLSRTRVFSLTEDHEGAMWFGSITGGASRLLGETAVRFTVAPLPAPMSTRENVSGLAGADVQWIFEDREHDVWLASGNGVSRWDGESLTNYTTADGLVHDSVYAIAQDAEGRLWFGTQGGICWWDGKAFHDFAEVAGRTFENVRAVAVDREGRMWFGGQQGAFRWDGKALAAFGTDDGLLSTFVGSLLVDRKGNVWMGHPGRFPQFQDGGASRYDGESFTRFTRKDGLTLDTVYCLCEDKDGRIWFGSAGDGACRWDGETFVDFSAEAPLRR